MPRIARVHVRETLGEGQLDLGVLLQVADGAVDADLRMGNDTIKTDVSGV